MLLREVPFWTVRRAVPSRQNSTSPQASAAASDRLRPPSAITPMIARSTAARAAAGASIRPPRPRRGSSPCSTSARSAWSPPGRSSSLRPSPVPSRPSWSDSTRRAYSGQWRQFVARADDVAVPWLPAAPVDVAEYLTALVGEPVLQRCGRRGPFCPPGYVRRSEDRFCEPRSPRLDHQRCWMTHKFSGPGAVTEANSPAAYSPFPRLRGRSGQGACQRNASG